jgi:hypothetical protein
LRLGFPKQANQQPNNLPNMSEETNKPESISDEQLEDVAGGINDTTSIQSVSCSNVLSTVNIA